MSSGRSSQSIYLASGHYTHPLDASTRRLWSIMVLAARDIEAMTDEKGAEWSGKGE